MEKLEEIKVGNMNRLVKVARREYKQARTSTYQFDALTGEIVKYTGCLEGSNDFYGITSSSYPVYDSKGYIGCMWLGQFCAPETFYAN